MLHVLRVLLRAARYVVISVFGGFGLEKSRADNKRMCRIVSMWANSCSFFRAVPDHQRQNKGTLILGVNCTFHGSPSTLHGISSNLCNERVCDLLLGNRLYFLADLFLTPFRKILHRQRSISGEGSNGWSITLKALTLAPFHCILLCLSRHIRLNGLRFRNFSPLTDRVTKWCFVTLADYIEFDEWSKTVIEQFCKEICIFYGTSNLFIGLNWPLSHAFLV